MGSRTRRVIQAVILASGLLVGPGGLLPPAERAHAAPAPSAAAAWQGYLDGHAQLAHRLAAVVGAPLERLAAVAGAPLDSLAAAVVGTPLERLLGAVLPEAGPGRAAPAGAASGILGALVGRPGFDGQPAAVLAQGSPTLGARPAVVAAGGTLGATWSGIVGPTAKDWVGVYVPGAPDGSSRPAVWRYTDGSAAADVAVPIPAGFASGTYELRLFANDGYTRLATSNCFVETHPASFWHRNLLTYRAAGEYNEQATRVVARREGG